LDVINKNAAGQVQANILQDNCFVAVDRCNEEDCIASAQAAAVFRVCHD